MSVAVPARRSEVDAIPEAIQSPSAKLVYLYLATARRATADELADRLNMKKLTLFSVLGTLEGRDLVESDGGAYRPA